MSILTLCANNNVFIMVLYVLMNFQISSAPFQIYAYMQEKCFIDDSDCVIEKK